MIPSTPPLLLGYQNSEVQRMAAQLQPFLLSVYFALSGRLSAASVQDDQTPNIDGAVVDVAFDNATTIKLVPNPLDRDPVGIIPILQIQEPATAEFNLHLPAVRFNTTAVDDGLNLTQDSTTVTVNVSAGTQVFTTNHVGGWLMPTGSVNAPNERIRIAAYVSPTQVTLERPWATASESDIAGLAQLQMDKDAFWIGVARATAWVRLWVF